MEECLPSKQGVAGSNPVSRSTSSTDEEPPPLLSSPDDAHSDSV